MCLAIPAKVLEADGSQAVVDILGVRRNADLSLLEDVAVGDFVLLHAGFGIEKLDPEAAEETLELHRQIAALELEEEPWEDTNERAVRQSRLDSRSSNQ